MCSGLWRRLQGKQKPVFLLLHIHSQSLTTTRLREQQVLQAAKISYQCNKDKLTENCNNWLSPISCITREGPLRHPAQGLKHKCLSPSGLRVSSGFPWQPTSSPSGKTKGQNRISHQIRLGSNTRNHCVCQSRIWRNKRSWTSPSQDNSAAKIGETLACGSL